MSPDAAREKAQSSVARLESVGSGGGRGGPCRGGLGIKELDSQRAEESASMTEAQERLKRLLEAQSRGPTIQPQDPGSQVTSLHQQMVNTLQVECNALAQARQTVEDDIQPVTEKQAVVRQVSSFRDPHVPVPLMPRHVPNDVDVGGPSGRVPTGLQGDLMHVTELGKLIAEGSRIQITTVHPSSVSNMVTT